MTKVEKLSVEAARNALKVPELTYVAVQVPNTIGIVKRGEMGYYKTDFLPGRTFDETKEIVNFLNDRMGVTRGQSEAALMGSQFGWYCPAANAENYNEAGILIREKLEGAIV